MSELGKDSFVSDQPVASKETDVFGRWHFAQRIANIVKQQTKQDGLVIGIYGEWGDGKTSVLNFIESELLDQEEIIIVRFNPWFFHDETTLLNSFFETLADALNRKLPTRAQELGEKLRKYGRIASMASISLFGLSLTPGQAIEKVGQELSTIDIYKLKERIEQILAEERKRVLVFMDDIDRLDKNEVHAILKLVKLSADFAHTSYILAFDEEIVAASLGDRYGLGDITAGKRFLEKIVQVPLRLPNINSALLQRFCFRCIDEALLRTDVQLTEHEEREFATNFLDAFLPRMNTPRSAKRFGNALSFALPLLEGEVNLVDLMLVEGVRIFYPELYQAMRTKPDIFLGQNLLAYGSYHLEKAKNETQKIIGDALKSLSSEEQESVHTLLEYLFPRMETAFKQNYQPHGNDTEKGWEAEKRISSSSYYARYFSYGISSNDVSDTEFSGFLKELHELSQLDISHKLSTWLNSTRALIFIQKLKRNINIIAGDEARKLVIPLTKMASRLSKSDGGFISWFSTFEQAALCISDLIKTSHSQDARLQLGQEVVAASEPIEFAISVINWGAPRKNTETDSTWSTETTELLYEAVAERIERLLTNAEKPIYITDTENTVTYLSILARKQGREKTSQYLVSSFLQDPIYSLKFLRLYASTWTDMSTGQRTVRNIDSEAFESISRVIEPAALLKELGAALGEQLPLGSEQFGYVEGLKDDQAIEHQLAHQFALLFKQRGLSNDDGASINN